MSRVVLESGSPEFDYPAIEPFAREKTWLQCRSRQAEIRRWKYKRSRSDGAGVVRYGTAARAIWSFDRNRNQNNFGRGLHQLVDQRSFPQIGSSSCSGFCRRGPVANGYIEISRRSDLNALDGYSSTTPAVYRGLSVNPMVFSTKNKKIQKIVDAVLRACDSVSLAEVSTVPDRHRRASHSTHAAVDIKHFFGISCMTRLCRAVFANGVPRGRTKLLSEFGTLAASSTAPASDAGYITPTMGAD